ncbi:transcriptional regulation of mitochondrial recombination-domain-containing protein [Hyaloscypha finlandica]|nr:transcriptional regulation of mitochondrial recombination-domain-containing protein [Hyaloscypha finlandica]
MSARTTTVVVGQATKSVRKARGASKTALPKPQSNRPEHGRQIFVYNHLQKNHVVYSLTRTLKNNASLAQLPFNGKKTVPAALRKDLWHPFAQISFPPGHGEIGLSVFSKLREYRRRHELEWGDEIRFHEKQPDEKLQFRSTKLRGRLICDQKANSVADIAAVLGRLELQEGEEVMKKGGIGLKGEGTGAKVEVLWNNLNDAEFAETWSENIEHGVWRHHKHTVDVDMDIVPVAEAEPEKGSTLVL